MFITLFAYIRDLMDELDSTPEPIPWGKAQKFKSNIAEGALSLYDEEFADIQTAAFAYGYCAYMHEFIEKLKSKQCAEYVKRK